MRVFPRDARLFNVAIRFATGAALLGASCISLSTLAAPAINPIPNVSIPAGKSLILPVTASSPTGLPLTFSATSSTNHITVQVHTNNPFWKMSVAQVASPSAPGAYSTPFRGATATVTNIGDMTFMLFRDIAPRTVDVFQGLTASGMYTSNTIFHRVIAGFMNQGGDPSTNGAGGPVFRYDDEFYPQAIFSGNGQLALANSGKDTDGSQFFVTVAPFRSGDFGYTIFGQLLRGFNVLSNINQTPVDSNSRPLADVIITQTSLVLDNFDTVLTLTATNKAGISGSIKVIADDGAGGRTTNSFTATTAVDSTLESPFLYPNHVANLIGPAGKSLTNFVFAYDFPGVTNNWYVQFADQTSYLNASNSFYHVVTNQLEFVIVPRTNYAGPVSCIFYVSPDPSFATYDQQAYTFAFGDTPIYAAGSAFIADALAPFSNQIVATFTNGLPNSPITNFTAFINWGDNSTNAGVIATNLLGFKEVHGSHTYTNPGDYPVYIAIQSSFGDSATAISSASIPPALSIARSGTLNTLTWPAWASSYQLVSSPSLLSTNWTAPTPYPSLLGFQTVLTSPIGNGPLFFRLQK